MGTDCLEVDLPAKVMCLTVVSWTTGCGAFSMTFEKRYFAILEVDNG